MSTAESDLTVALEALRPFAQAAVELAGQPWDAPVCEGIPVSSFRIARMVYARHIHHEQVPEDLPEDQPEGQSLEYWRNRALNAEAELVRLRTNPQPFRSVEGGTSSFAPGSGTRPVMCADGHMRGSFHG